MAKKTFLLFAYLGLTLIAYGLWAAIQYQLNWATGQWSLLYGGAGCWLALILHIAIRRRFAKEGAVSWSSQSNFHHNLLVTLCGLMLSVAGFMILGWEIHNIRYSAGFDSLLFLSAGLFYILSAAGFPLALHVVLKRCKAKQQKAQNTEVLISGESNSQECILTDQVVSKLQDETRH